MVGRSESERALLSSVLAHTMICSKNKPDSYQTQCRTDSISAE